MNSYSFEKLKNKWKYEFYHLFHLPGWTLNKTVPLASFRIYAVSSLIGMCDDYVAVVTFEEFFEVLWSTFGVEGISELCYCFESAIQWCDLFIGFIGWYLALNRYKVDHHSVFSPLFLVCVLLGSILSCVLHYYNGWTLYIRTRSFAERSPK